jgi:SAM-dependent methyltransferase
MAGINDFIARNAPWLCGLALLHRRWRRGSPEQDALSSMEWIPIISAALDRIVESGQERAFVDLIAEKWRDPNWERNKFYHLQECLLSNLLLDLRLIQGASLRTVNIADQYVEIARRYFPSFAGRHILEIGPGRNLGAGIAFRYLGAERYTGVEFEAFGSEFNTWATLNTIECLVRIKYGSFLDNFNAAPLGIVPSLQGPADQVALDNKGIFLLRPASFSEIELPDGSVDMVYSNFTFEHLQRPEATVHEIARLLKPGGITAHSDFSRPFDYLTFSDDEWEAHYTSGRKPLWTYENRCRASDFRRFFESAGLELMEDTPLRSAPIADELFARIAPRFQAYDRDDLEVVWLMIVGRKP